MFSLASERALDSLCLATSRARLSHGQLDGTREYDAANKTHQRIYRPCIGGVYEDITQRDLDVLRAVISKYIADGNCYPFIKADPDATIMTCPDTILNRDDLITRVVEGAAIEVEITPQQIRQILQKRKDVLDTASITHSLKKWEALRLEGSYKVRMADSKAVDIPINGNLLYVEVGNGGNRSAYYQIIFATKWGRLFMHNVHTGNLANVNDELYPKWGEGEKNIYYTVFAFPNDEFRRRAEDLLSILNIKVGKNKQRAVGKLNQCLNQLQKMGYIEWQCKDRAYYIKRKAVPKESKASHANDINENIIAEKSDQCKVDSKPEAMNQVSAMCQQEKSPIDLEKQYYRELATTLDRKSDKTNSEKAYVEIIESVERLSRLTKGWAPDDTFAASIKMSRLCKWQDYSKYYLWAVVEKHESFRKKLEEERAKEVFFVLNILNQDEELKKDILNFIEQVEKAYKVYFTPGAEEAAISGWAMT